jgi:guanylate kinase
MAIGPKRRGLLIVLSAPSGGGKSTILRSVVERIEGLSYSISATSRPPRGHEVDGRDYFFLTSGEFERRARAGEFLEHAMVHGNHYGTPRSAVEEALVQGRDVALDLDVQGGLEVKRQFPDAALVFVMPPSSEVLEARLRGRGDDSEEEIRKRLANARREMEFRSQYDHVVVNECLDEAVQSVENIIRDERLKASRKKPA